MLQCGMIGTVNLIVHVPYAAKQDRAVCDAPPLNCGLALAQCAMPQQWEPQSLPCGMHCRSR